MKLKAPFEFVIEPLTKEESLKVNNATDANSSGFLVLLSTIVPLIVTCLETCEYDDWARPKVVKNKKNNRNLKAILVSIVFASTIVSLLS